MITGAGFFNFITAYEGTILDTGIDHIKSEVKLELNKWLQEGGNINEVIDQNGNALLHRAALNGRATLVQALIDSGADTMAPNYNGQSALEICQIKKISITTTSTSVREAAPPIAPSSEKSKASIFDYNVMKGKDAAALEEYLQEMKASGADINAFNGRGMTCLHEACFDVNVIAVKLIHKYGGDVNLNTLAGNGTCLHLSLMGNNESGAIELVKFFLTT